MPSSSAFVAACVRCACDATSELRDASTAAAAGDGALLPAAACWYSDTFRSEVN